MSFTLMVNYYWPDEIETSQKERQKAVSEGDKAKL